MLNLFLRDTLATGKAGKCRLRRSEVLRLAWFENFILLGWCTHGQCCVQSEKRFTFASA